MSLSPYTRIPDTLNIGDYIASNCNPLSARPSNSVLDWAPKLGQDLRRRIVLDTELYELENDTDTVTGAQPVHNRCTIHCTVPPTLCIEWTKCDSDSFDSCDLMILSNNA